ncbi:hypothetical protein D3C78_1990920 [compost metagenome]
MKNEKGLRSLADIRRQFGQAQRHGFFMDTLHQPSTNALAPMGAGNKEVVHVPVAL